MGELAALRSENESLQRQLLLARERSAELERATELPRHEALAPRTSPSAAPSGIAEAKLARNEHLLRAIFEGALDAMLLANDRGEYVDANPAACELFGVPLEQLVGRTIVEFAAAGYDFEGANRAFLEHGQLLGHFPLQRPDGSLRVLEFRAVANVVPGLHLSVLRDVTDQTAAEEALRRSEARFRAVIEKSTEAFSLTRADGTTEYLTRTTPQWLGWHAETVGQSMTEAPFPADHLLPTSALDHFVLSGERDLTLAVRVRHGDGAIRWIETTATNLLDDPDVRAIVGIHRNITERKLAEETLREGRRLLEEAQAIAHVGSFISAKGAKEWSPECYRIFGVPQGEVVTAGSFLARVHPADREEVTRASRDAHLRGAPYEVEHRVQWPDGRVRWVRERAVVECASADRAERMIGTVADITDQRVADQALRASEERYRRIVESTSEGVWIYDGEGVTTFMNSRMASMLGVTADEAVGQPVSAFMDAATGAAVPLPIERRERASSERHDLHLRRKDGSDLWASMRANSLFDPDGHFEAVVALLTDISAERVFEQARARLASIVEWSEDAIMSVGLDGEILTWNRSAEKLYQYPAHEVVGTSILDLMPPAILEDERRVFDRARCNEPVLHHETRRLRKDGSEVEVSLTISPIRNAAGDVIAISKIARDLTARGKAAEAHRRTEEQFRQAQKMEAVGRLAGGVAHDFNNLLSVVLSYSSLAVADLKAGDPLRDDMREIQAAGERGTALTRQLLAFSRQQVLQPRVLDLSEIVDGMRSMLGRLLGEDVELSVVTGSDIGRIEADPGQIEQVVMNLAVNARDAMPVGGSLTVSLANVELDAASSARAFAGAAPGPYVSITVSDDGTGMDPATRTRIFEPFFTTKEPGKGTGLGLATVFGIVKQSGGYIGVESAPGKGSVFTVYLPRTEEEVDAPSSDVSPLLRRGTETILLVEDENEVRAVARIILRRQGYQVLEAANGGEAFLIAQEYSPAIHLLLTDVVMPRMSGRKLAEQLALKRPEMKLLFVSGYTDDAIVRHGVLEAGVAFLQKPFTPDSLLRKVRDVLDAPRGDG